MPLTSVNTLTKKNVVFVNILESSERLIHFPNGGEQTPFREKDVSKDSDREKD